MSYVKLRAREAALATKHARNTRKVKWWRKERERRQARLARLREKYGGEGKPSVIAAWDHAASARSRVERWYEAYETSRDELTKVRRQLRALHPPLISADQLGLRFQYVWGNKGAPYRGAGHYTAGQRAADKDALAAEMRSDHAFHAGKGWGGISYEYMVADDGTIGLGNPVDRMSAGVANNNTGLINICCPGTTGDRMTAEQKASVAWLLDNAHTTALPKAHRSPRPLRELSWRGHKEYPSNSTACPGDMLADYREVWR